MLNKKHLTCAQDFQPDTATSHFLLFCVPHTALPTPCIHATSNTKKEKKKKNLNKPIEQRGKGKGIGKKKGLLDVYVRFRSNMRFRNQHEIKMRKKKSIGTSQDFSCYMNGLEHD